MKPVLFAILAAMLLAVGCKGGVEHYAGAPGRPPIFPSSWTVTNWYVDPQNSTGAASDSNNCTSSSTPCLTWHEINDGRWGCLGSPSGCPRLQQTTTVTFLSSQTTQADPIYAFPMLEGTSGPSLVLQGNLGAAQTACSGALANVTAKNRATPQLLQASVGVCTLSAGELLQNTTHPSFAWAYKLVSGATWSITQPLSASTPGGYQGLTAVDTWTTGDTVTVYQLPTVVIGSLGATVQYSNGNPNTVTAYHLNLGLTTSNVTYLNDQANLIESTNLAGSGIQYRSLGGANGAFVASMSNDYLPWSIHGGSASFAGSEYSPNIIGGYIDWPTIPGAGFDFDVIVDHFSSIQPIANSCQVGTLYIAAGTTLNVTAGPCDLTNAPFSATKIIWGPGTINIAGSARMKYVAGAGAAAAQFLNTGGLQLNGQTKACLVNPAASTTTWTCNLTLSAANLDSNLGATSGCLTTGNSAICNF